MASTALIVGGLAAAGAVAYILYKRSQAKPKSDCQKACDALLDGAEKTACEAACNVDVTQLLGGFGDLAYTVANAIPGVSDKSQDFVKALDADDATNRNLNGDVEMWLPPELRSPPIGKASGVQTMQGSVLRFKNGCVPFSYAPGFEKCNTGTKSMWVREVQDRAGAAGHYNTGIFPAFANETLANEFVTEHDLGNEEAPNSKAQLLSGQALTGYGDASTQGPFPAGAKIGARPCSSADKVKSTSGLCAETTVPDGSVGWLFRGRPMICPQGQAPGLWAPDGKPRSNIDPRETPPCVPSGRYTKTGGSISSTGGAQQACPPPAGFTWSKATDGTWYLRRLRVGETYTGACPPGASSGPSSSSSSSIQLLNSLGYR